MNKPCGTCPYRISTPIGIWDISEYENLQDNDHPMGGTFGCHLDDGSLCRGWVTDQKRRGMPSIRLRIYLGTHDEAADMVRDIDTEDPDLYPSIQAMVEANLDKPFPVDNAVAQKIKRLKEGS